jgi:hypothetical protein
LAMVVDKCLSLSFYVCGMGAIDGRVASFSVVNWVVDACGAETNEEWGGKSKGLWDA